MLKEARAARGWTQDDLAEACGVTRWTVMRWEKGGQKGEPENLRAVAEALDIPPVVAFQAIGWLPADEEATPSTLQQLLEDPMNKRFWELSETLPRSERINLLREYATVRELEAKARGARKKPTSKG